MKGRGQISESETLHFILHPLLGDLSLATLYLSHCHPFITPCWGETPWPCTADRAASALVLDAGTATQFSNGRISSTPQHWTGTAHRLLGRGTPTPVLSGGPGLSGRGSAERPAAGQPRGLGLRSAPYLLHQPRRFCLGRPTPEQNKAPAGPWANVFSRTEGFLGKIQMFPWVSIKITKWGIF